MEARDLREPERQHEEQQRGAAFENATTLAELTSIDGSHWKLCLHPFEYKRSLNPDLDGLIRESATNPFFNTAFVAASRDRMTRHQLLQLVVWEAIGNASVPRFCVPLYLVPKKFLVPEHFRTLTHPFAPFGDPLLDVNDTRLVLERVVSLLEIAFDAGLAPISFDDVSEFSAFSDIGGLLTTAGYAVSSQGRRAAIRPGTAGSGRSFMSAKRGRELNRQLKNLTLQGDVTFEQTQSQMDTILRLEEFLLMESRSWKGKVGSSIHVIKKHAAFARQATVDLAAQGCCEIHSMRFNGAPIASTVLFSSNGRYYPWKTTYDPLFSRYSPGSQLMRHMTDEITGRENFVSADSLAHTGKSWMNHLWPDTVSLSTIVLARDKRLADGLVSRFGQGRAIRQTVKRLISRR